MNSGDMFEARLSVRSVTTPCLLTFLNANSATFKLAIGAGGIDCEESWVKLNIRYFTDGTWCCIDAQDG